jgi:hypothetical protein
VRAIDLLAYRQDATLCAAYDVFQSRPPSDRAFGDFHDTLQRLLLREEKIRFDRYGKKAAKAIAILVEEEEVSEAGGEYLTLLTSQYDDVLMAAFAEYEDTKNSPELMETLVRLSERWRAVCYMTRHHTILTLYSL